MSRKMSPLDIALSAEERAVEEGHRARYDLEKHCFLVKSDTTDTSYHVGVEAVLIGPWPALRFPCDCKSGKNRSHLSVACKHGALVARRLERMKLAHLVPATSFPWRPLGVLLEVCRDQAREQPKDVPS